ncbi:DUF502 domain-containing protein [Foetidibacter luteolus]|uniref:DUF502 domain-containing protein n=1 Tax=Foetidibacter luteolus TaxID=2608880 RepID=UPI001F22896C|nr:DUF502 domain-containing protein [Foetidibacter luteolus]
MTNMKRRLMVKWHWRRLLQFFLQGLVVIAPIGVTIYAVYFLFTTVDGILPNIIYKISPEMIGVDETGEPKRIPGLGFIVVILIVMFIGAISSSFFVGKMVDVLDTVLERTPGIKFIYTSVKDFLEAFAGNKKKFDKPVLVNVDAHDVWRLGFVTQNDAENFGLIDHVVVYIPHSYAISGITYFVPKQNIKPIENIHSGEAMKFVVSGGVTHLVE